MCHMSFGRKQEVLQVRQPIRSSTVKRLIVVLAILLALSLAALCAVRYYGRQAGRAAEAPGNGIQTAAQPAGAPVPTAARTGKVTIRLYDRSPEYNREFSVTNMFPGDAETQNDCVQVDHKGDVTVHFRAEVRPGYEKLAEVLKLRVSVGGSVVYDGRHDGRDARRSGYPAAGRQRYAGLSADGVSGYQRRQSLYVSAAGSGLLLVGGRQRRAGTPYRRHHAAPVLGSGSAGVRRGTDGAAASPQGGVP